MEELLLRESLGDMEASYWLWPETQVVSLQINPSGWEARRQPKNQNGESLVQLRLRGDDFPFGFANGHTLRNGASAYRFKFKRQDVRRDSEKTRIITVLEAPGGLAVEHRLTHYKGARGVEAQAVFFNGSDTTATLEMFSSFSISGLTPYAAGDAPDSLVLHRLRSRWSGEGRLVSETVEDLQLEPSWTGHGVASEKFGQVGSLPVRRWFPFAAVEDRPNGVVWGVLLHAPASWQIEVYRKDDGLCLSGGLADYDFGHWAKDVHPGESFASPVACLTACAGSLDELCDRLTDMQRRALNALPRPERLPVVFNEFCATWGCPTQARTEAALSVLRDRDVDCFVIDCGWYAQAGRSWEMNMGDWRVNEGQFPEGLEGAARAIRAAGMRPGLWFEAEICGRESDAFALETHQLKRHDVPITAGFRRFWDLRDPWVRDYLAQKVIAPLADHGFEYVKIDYNESAGVGCDGAESLGEGLRQAVAASQDFFRELRARIPGLMIEICASGGHRLEPSFLGLGQLASATDAHEERELPIIAANLHRVMLPEQSLIWAVLRRDDSPRRLVWSIAATFLGVMCLSGDVEALSEAQWEVIGRGIAFYRQAEALIRDGFTTRRGPAVDSYRHPTGWQAVERTARDGKRKLIVAHVFDGAPARLSIPVGEGYAMECVYAEDPGAVALADGIVTAKLDADSAFAVLLQRQDMGAGV